MLTGMGRAFTIKLDCLCVEKFAFSVEWKGCLEFTGIETIFDVYRKGKGFGVYRNGKGVWCLQEWEGCLVITGMERVFGVYRNGKGVSQDGTASRA